MAVHVEAFFLDAGNAAGDRRYCILRRPADRACHAAMVYVHPFAEEMNKSRRMAALQATALAESGVAVLQIDLHGCGDSSGDFGSASWAGWVDDAAGAARWLRARHAGLPFWFWGLRAGALVATAAANRVGEACNFLFWQPTLEGTSVLQQFLRLHVVGKVLDGQSRTSVAALRQQLISTGQLEIGGYLLKSRLADGLEQALLQPPTPSGRLVWLETSTLRSPRLGPASAAAVEAWVAAGWQVDAAAVAAPAFWQSTEIEEAPSLVSATLEQLQGATT